MITRRTVALGGAAALTAALSPITRLSAQAYPSQTVKIVVPFGAGSVTDIVARILAEEMSKRWKQQVIIENRPGLPGTVAVAQATADGHTLMVTSNGHTVSGLTNKNLTFDPIKDFSGITRLCSSPLYLIVPPDLPAKDLKEVIALAKAKPKTLNFSSPGLASTTFIAGALFRKAAGIDIVHVPYKSAPEATTAVVRGDVQLYMAPVNQAKELTEGGKVRAIAAATAQRIPDMPNVPTFTEAGLPFVYDSWFGLLTESGVPRDLVAKINHDIVEAVKSPDMQAKFKAQFVLPLTDTPEQFDKIIRDETANLTQVFKEAGI